MLTLVLPGKNLMHRKCMDLIKVPYVVVISKASWTEGEKSLPASASPASAAIRIIDRTPL